MNMKKIMVLLLISIWIFPVQAQNLSEVKVYEGKEDIPTYKLGPNESSPVFYTGRGVQGAAGHIYPYPAQTSLSDKLTTVTYDMVYLENEYLKVTILPAFGGKLFSAIDKTNGHELFHRNSVIKPDLIGTLGAWISGGIEWCFPHHHRPTTLLPADYIMEKNDDGSATVWIGETERGLRLRGVIGITLHPGRSYIEVNYRLNNTTDITENFLFWANVAVTANENFRTFWPPSQEIGVFHSNTSFTQWPISHQVYRGIDYTSGVDLTWWKNHPSPVSFFFWQAKEGFIGGYDYAKSAGTIHVGDVYENKASKLWQFGPGLEGQNADRKLTDDGKAYVELMTGTFSNNQPDYSWFFPHSVKEATNYWYPIRDIEIAKNATTDASVTLQMRDSKTVFYGFNTTKSYKGAKAVLKNGDEVLVTKKVDIDPATPFTSTFKSKRELDEYQLYVELQDSDGKKLVSYRPYKLQYPKLPEVQEEPKSPQEIESVEDLYLTGRFVEQFSRPGLNPDDYYLEALRKSPDDYRVNIAMGIRRVNQWRYDEAEEYLQKAADKLRVKYIQPKEGELFYYLALAQKGIGKSEEAYRNFFQASWYYEWYSSAYFQLALMESNKGNFEKAIEFVKNAYSNDNNDGGITILYSALLRKQGEQEKALALVNKLLEFDPLNFSAIYEKELLKGNSSLVKWHKNMQDIDNNYLDIALNYVKAGLFDDGINLLSSLENPKNPLVLYYLAWLYSKDNQPSKASEMLVSASRISFDYCFPFRQETEKVLKYAIETDSQNAVACYLLGNLLYDKRPDEAMKTWHLAVQVKNDFPMVWRNLAFGAFYHENDIENSIKYMKKAIAEDPSHPLWYAELENYYDLSQSDFRECLAIMEKNIDIVKMDITAPITLVKLYNLNGEYAKSIDLLKSHHFRTWEGGREIYYHYVDAHVLKAMDLMKDDKNEAAVEELNTAMLYPLNLEVGKPLDDERNAMIYYFLGKAFNKMANMEKAKEFYEKSTLAINTAKWADLTYYQAKSFEELGNSAQATKMFQELITKGKLILEKGIGTSGIGVEEISLKNNKSLSEAYYLQALGNIGLGNVDEANNLLQKALKEYKNNLWAKLYLNNFK
jgi:tetratricopeptide (TPR) repeat protein